MDDQNINSLKSSDSMKQELLYKDLTPNVVGPAI